MFILNLKEKRHEVGGSLQREHRVLAGRLVPRVLEVTAAINHLHEVGGRRDIAGKWACFSFGGQVVQGLKRRELKSFKFQSKETF